MVFKTSIIILTYNNLDYTRQCLESIYDATPLEDFEIVVVDNASQDETPSFLQEFAPTHPNFRYLLNRENRGFAAGNNQGIDLAQGAYIVFLNNDVVVTRDWLAGLVAHLQDPKVGMIGPVTNSAGNECRIPVDYQDLSGMTEFAARYTAAHQGQFFKIKMLPLHCAALRRSTVDEIGGLDERFGLGMFEDDDYAIRLAQAGYSILCVEDVYVHHFGSASFARLGASTYWRLFIENRKKFEEKWGIRWQPHMLRPELVSQQVEQLVEGSIYLGGITASQEDVINQLSETLKERDQEIQELDQRNSQLSVDLENRKAYIAEVHGSRAWRLIQFIWHVQIFLIPPGSLRARILHGKVSPLQFVHEFFGLFRRGANALLKRLIVPLARIVLFRLLPGRYKRYYEDFRFQMQYVDRSLVTLYADEDVLPSYSPRCLLAREENISSGKIKVSLISTVKNEAASAVVWLEFLLKQTRQPDEVVITDGGSTDGTLAILRDFSRTFSIPIHVLEAPGTNISQGRNIAIQSASYPNIACSDFHSILDHDWLSNLIAPLERDRTIDMSAGFYQAVIKDDLDRLCAHYFIPDMAAIRPQAFLPSGRSVAFRKQFWARVGGYPEWLSDAGEDTLFDYQAKSQPSHWAFVPQAKAAWFGPRTFRKMYRTFYRYARGDGEAALHASLYWEKTVNAIEQLFTIGVVLLLVILSVFINRAWTVLLLVGSGGLAFLNFLVHSRQASKIYKVSFKLGMVDTLFTWLIDIAQISGFARGVGDRPDVQKRRMASYEEKLKNILLSYPDRTGVIIYPPTHDWGFMFQRPQQMARAFAGNNYLYFYCTNNEKTDTVTGFYEVEPGLYLCHVPLETFHLVEKPVVYIGSPWHRNVLSVFDRPIVVYDHYDDLEVSSANPQDHYDLLKLADIVLVTSQKLVESTRELRPDSIFAPNGVDYRFIQDSRPQTEDGLPPDLKPIAEKGCPIIGYSGAFAEWFDYELLRFRGALPP